MSAIPERQRCVLLKSRPAGIPQAEHFEVVEAPVEAPGPGQVVVRNEFLSVEPAMRGWVNAAANYSDPVPVGGVMRAFAAGVVVASRNAGYSEGDLVMGMLGWQEYSTTEVAVIRRKVLESDLPLSLSLGVLGINGVTAYFALREVGAPQAGDTVVVSTASGAVGSAVGQIAKLMGCRTVGIAGGPVKARSCIEDFGYDMAVDYKAEDFHAELERACPNGVNVYFDNTAGPISDAVLRHLAKNARVVVCGTASLASWDPWPGGPRVERHLLNKTARLQGFLVWDYEHRYEEAVAQLAQWVRDGSLRYREEILDGIDKAPGSIAQLYEGANFGKRLIRLTST